VGAGEFKPRLNGNGPGLRVTVHTRVIDTIAAGGSPDAQKAAAGPLLWCFDVRANEDAIVRALTA
jgi:hypothetical protein